MTYSDELLYYATEESQKIEGEPVQGKSFTNHKRATLLTRTAAESKQLLHPRILQQILAEGLSLPPNHQPGDYRSVRVYVNTSSGPHFFPPPEQVSALMSAWWDQWERFWTKNRDAINQDLVRWWFHAWFEAIHPFPDFNGRTGRCLLWGTDMLVDKEIEIVTYSERQYYYDRLVAWRVEHCNKLNMNPFR